MFPPIFAWRTMATVAFSSLPWWCRNPPLTKGVGIECGGRGCADGVSSIVCPPKAAWPLGSEPHCWDGLPWADLMHKKIRCAPPLLSLGAKQIDQAINSEGAVIKDGCPPICRAEDRNAGPSVVENNDVLRCVRRASLWTADRPLM